MTGKNHNLGDCIKTLSKKNGVKLMPHENKIYIEKEEHDLGIKSWGKVDYLANFLKFKIYFV